MNLKKTNRELKRKYFLLFILIINFIVISAKINRYKNASEFSNLSSAYLELGEYYQSHGQFDEAYFAYKKAIEQANSVNDYIICHKGYRFLADIEMERSKYLFIKIYFSGFCKGM